MNILLTGATGFLGRNVLDYLKTKREPLMLYCLVRNPDNAIWLSDAAGTHKIHMLQGDLEQPDTLAQLPDTLDWVFHMGGLVGRSAGAACYGPNVEGTRNLLAAVSRSTTLQRFVFISTIDAMGRPAAHKGTYPPMTRDDVPIPETDYGKSKLQAEATVRESGLPFTILRPGYIHGPYPRLGSTMDRIIMDVQDENPYTRLPFPGRASEIHAHDLADLLWRVAGHAGCLNQTFLATNPQPVAVADAFKTLYRTLGKPHRAYPIPRFALPWLRTMMRKEGLSSSMAAILFDDYFACDPAPLWSLLDCRPYYGFEAGMVRTVRWYQDHGRLTR